MGIHGKLLLLLLLSPILASAQAPGPPPPTPAPDATPKSLGSYSLVVTSQEPSPATHLLTPPLLIDVAAATVLAPGDASGTKSLPPQYLAEDFANPRYDCIPGPPAVSAPRPAGSAASAPSSVVERVHGCDAIDRAELTLRDPSTVGFHIANHGPAAQLEINLRVHDLQPVSRSELQGTWHAAEVIFIAVPKPTPSDKVVSATLIGDWDGNAVVFEPGKPLPDGAKKALEDLNIHQDLGDKTLYSYKVKDPKPAK
jgi:hypothetical protein